MEHRVSLDDVDAAVAALAEADSPSDVLNRMLEGSRLGSPRSALFLLHGGKLKGWGCSGYPSDAKSRLGETSMAATQSWLLRFVENPDGRSERLRPEESPLFGQSRAAEVVAVPVRVGQRPVALLIAERKEQEGPWVPALLTILASVARSRLALDLARRRLALSPTETDGEKSEAPEPAPQAPPVGHTTAPVEQRPEAAELATVERQPEAPEFEPVESHPTPTEHVPQTTPDELATVEQQLDAPEFEPVESHPTPTEFALPEQQPEATELVPVEQRPAPETELPDGPLGPRQEGAKRYARLIATDIRLYNEEAVMLGRRHRDLAERLSDQLERGREAFGRRYPNLGAAGLQILHEAYVQVLAGGDAELIGAPTDP